jgi:hypothetical protein
MHDDPRIKRVLKRYRKDEQFSDASMDVSALGLTVLLQACRSDDADYLTAPKELDDYAVAHLSDVMGIEFNRDQFDYFLHSYVRQECASEFFADPLVTSKPAPESGPPIKIPLPKGMHWCSVRPKDGKEHYEAYEFDETKEG